MAKSKAKVIGSRMNKQELLKTVKSWAKTLAELDQRPESQDKARHIKEQLNDPVLLNHKDKGVKVYTAVCLAEVLRLYAPDPIYSVPEFKKIFGLFLSQIEAAKKPTDPHFEVRLQLFKALADIRAFALCDMIQAFDIYLDLFKLCFSILSSENARELGPLFEELLFGVLCDYTPHSDEAYDALFENLTPSAKRANPEGYKLAVAVITQSKDKLGTSIHEFFNPILGIRKHSESNLVEDVYEVLYELIKIDVSMMLTVIPMLESQLRIEDEDKRVVAATLIGRMFLKKGGDLKRAHPSLWKEFLARMGDISPKVRTVIVKHAPVLLSDQTLREEANQCISDGCGDGSEKVREATIKHLGEVALNNLQDIPADALQVLGSRCKDKKAHIRETAVNILGQLYQNALTRLDLDDIESFDSIDSDVADQIRVIPDAILSAAVARDSRHVVQSAISTFLLAERESALQRALRVALCWKYCSEKTRKFLTQLIQCSSRCGEKLRAFIDMEQENARFNQYAEYLAGVVFGDKAKDNQMKKLHESVTESKPMKQNLMIVSDPNQATDDIVKAKASLLNSGEHGVDILRAVVSSCRPIPVDSQSLIYSLRSLQKFEDQNEASMLSNLGELLVCQLQDKAVLLELLGCLKSESSLVQSTTISLLAHCKEAKLSRKDQKSLQASLKTLIVEGSPWQAKQGVKIAVSLLEDDKFLQSIGKELTSDDMLNKHSPRILATMKALGYIALLAPATFRSFSKKVVAEFVIDNLLPHATVVKDEDEEGIEERDFWDDTPSTICRAKVLAIKLLARNIIGIANLKELDPETLRTAAGPTIACLISIVELVGNVDPTISFKEGERSHLRLAAATSLLKIFSHLERMDKAYTTAPKHFLFLAMTMHDHSLHVRKQFAQKLHKYLVQNSLMMEYIAMLAFGASDPDPENRDMVRKLFLACVQTLRDRLVRTPKLKQDAPHRFIPEYAICYLIHTLAQHPDFDGTLEMVEEHQIYFDFFVQGLCKRGHETYPLLKAIVGLQKRLSDAHSPDSTKMYILCDLALAVINQQSSKIGWVWQDFNQDDIKVPLTLFVPGEHANPTHNYLPEGFSLHKHFSSSPTKKHRAASPLKKVAKKPKKERKKKAQKIAAPKMKNNSKKKKKQSTGPVRRNASRASRPAVSLKEVDDGEEEEEEEETDVAIFRKGGQSHRKFAQSDESDDSSIKDSDDEEHNEDHSEAPAEEREEQEDEDEPTPQTTQAEAEGDHDSEPPATDVEEADAPLHIKRRRRPTRQQAASKITLKEASEANADLSLLDEENVPVQEKKRKSTPNNNAAKKKKRATALKPTTSRRTLRDRN